MNKMIKTLLTTFLMLFALSPLVGLAHAAPSNVSLAPMLQKTTPGVVKITVLKVLPRAPIDLGKQKKPEQNVPTKAVAQGSGVVINAKKGLIVTNAHVVKNQKMMIVTLKDGRRYHAHLVGAADGYDIAVIQIKANHLTAIPFGDSDKLKVGDFVVAVGSPFGLTSTVTSGVVSALNRIEPPIEGFQDFIQTDTPINPGNSGGALLNTEGQLIGINTAIVSPTDSNIGIGFAIPSNMAKGVIMQLVKYGKIKRGMLGVVAQNVTPDLADALGLAATANNGVVVTQVVPDTPAAKAGVQSQDVIQAVNGRAVHSAAQLRNMMGITPPGQKITLQITRDHKKLSLEATVGNPKALMKQRAIPFINGMRLQKFSDLETDGTTLKGLIVTDRTDISAAALAGIMPGDVIISANGKATPSVASLLDIIKAHPKHLLLKIARGNGRLFLVIEPHQ